MEVRCRKPPEDHCPLSQMMPLPCPALSSLSPTLLLNQAFLLRLPWCRHLGSPQLTPLSSRDTHPVAFLQEYKRVSFHDCSRLFSWCTPPPCCPQTPLPSLVFTRLLCPPEATALTAVLHPDAPQLCLGIFYLHFNVVQEMESSSSPLQGPPPGLKIKFT